MLVKSAPELLAEFSNHIQAVPIALAKVRGALKGLELRRLAAPGPAEIEVEWILRAHIGTLEKICISLPADRMPSTLELLSAVRNTFENIIWLRLFEHDVKWGMTFYGNFLQENIEDINSLISKTECEIQLFKDADREDSEITQNMFDEMANDADSSDKLRSVTEKYESMREDLDNRVRRKFSLYSAAANFNGYGYQIHLLERKELPRCRKQLADIEKRLESFRLLFDDEKDFRRHTKRTNWRKMAEAVGMLDQYEYLYRLSSRLLHSGPMNILTEKNLTDGEQIALLEYMTVAALDVLEIIEGFRFAGRIDMLYIDVE